MIFKQLNKQGNSSSNYIRKEKSWKKEERKIIKNSCYKENSNNSRESTKYN